jgi:hypothetical protein
LAISVIDVTSANWLPDGSIALRNLDFAAHRRLIQGRIFKDHIIPQRAIALACQWSQTLAPILQEDKSRHGDQDYFQLCSPEALKKARQANSVKIFEQALRLKADLLVSTYQFEAVLYPPGSVFDNKGMIAEVMAGGRATPSQSMEVNLCLLPSLYALKREKKFVEYKNFDRRDSSQWKESERLTEAIVIVDDVEVGIH